MAYIADHLPLHPLKVPVNATSVISSSEIFKFILQYLHQSKTHLTTITGH